MTKTSLKPKKGAKIILKPKIDQNNPQNLRNDQNTSKT